jgi:hypothetical protein
MTTLLMRSLRFTLLICRSQQSAVLDSLFLGLQSQRDQSNQCSTLLCKPPILLPARKLNFEHICPQL